MTVCVCVCVCMQVPEGATPRTISVQFKGQICRSAKQGDEVHTHTHTHTHTRHARARTRDSRTTVVQEGSWECVPSAYVHACVCVCVCVCVCADHPVRYLPSTAHHWLQRHEGWTPYIHIHPGTHTRTRTHTYTHTLGMLAVCMQQRVTWDYSCGTDFATRPFAVYVCVCVCVCVQAESVTQIKQSYAQHVVTPDEKVRLHTHTQADAPARAQARSSHTHILKARLGSPLYRSLVCLVFCVCLCVCISQLQLERLAGEGDVYGRLARSLAPEIYGQEDVKKVRCTHIHTHTHTHACMRTS